MDYSIKIGGEAGQGIQTIGDTLMLRHKLQPVSYHFYLF